MGSIRVSPPVGSSDRRERDIQLSPRQSRAYNESNSKTLPSISALLPEMSGPSNGHSPLPSRGSRRSPPYQPRISPPQPASRPSPTSLNFPDRYSTHRRDEQQLPYIPGPPADRGGFPGANSGWSDRRPYSTNSASSPYSSQPVPAAHSPGYSAGSSASRQRDEEYHSSLPPPPPHYGHDRESASYSKPRDYAYDDSRYDSGHWHEAPRQPYSSYPPTPRESASRSYDTRVSGPGPHGSPAYASEAYHQAFSQLPPMHYDGRDDPPRKRRGNLPRWITDLLKAWFLEHIAHPYPSEQEKNELCMQTGCSMTQISNWFINARRRRTPELTRQAEAERRLRDHAGSGNQGRSSSNSE